jgi:hypothetical protein
MGCFSVPSSKNLWLVVLLAAVAVYMGSCGYAGTPPGNKSVMVAPAIIQQPANQTVTAGQSAAFSVTATGTNPLSYQWYMNAAAVGTNSSTYSISGTTLAQNGAQIYVNVTDPAATVQSSVVILTVNSAPTPPSISQQPASETVMAGQSASFSVAVTGTSPITYQWFLNGAPTGTNANIFSIPQTTTSETGAQVYVKVTNAQGSAKSNTAILTVGPAVTAPAISQQPVSVSVVAGQAATFSVTSTGTAPLVHQWFMNGAAAGTNSNIFSVPQTTTAETGAQIYVKVTNAQGSSSSNIAILTVTPAPVAPVITQQPVSSMVTAG